MNREKFDRLLQAVRSKALENDSDVVVFMGHPTDPLPRALLHDRDLPMAARVLWWYLRTRSDSPGGSGLTPDYETVRRELGMGSRSTVSDCFHALRITRWITQQEVYLGRVRRTVIILHEAPLTFAQAVELDPDYVERVESAMRSGTKRISTLAHQVLDGAMLAEQDGQDSMGGIHRLSAYAPGMDGEESWGEFSDSLFERGTADQIPLIDVPAEAAADRGPEPVFHDDILHFSEAQKKLATVKLNTLPREKRQEYLDDLAYRVLEQKDSHRPVRKPLAYLQQMVNQYHNGDEWLTGCGEKLEELKERVLQVDKVSEDNSLLERIRNELGMTESLERLISAEAGNPESRESLQRQLKQSRVRVQELKRSLNGGGRSA